MKIENGEFYTNNPAEDWKIRKYMGEILQKHYELQLEDLPEVLRKLGIKNTEYEISNFSLGEHGKASFYVVTKRNKTLVEFILGDMVNPYARVRVTKLNGKSNVYYISKIIKVERENKLLNFDNIDKEEARRLYEKVMKD